MKEKVVEMVTASVQEINEQLDKKVALERGEAAPLYGREGVLDSLALVSLIAAVEQAIQDEFGKNVTLADEKAMSQKHSPFKTIGTLSDYIVQRLQE